MVAVAVWLQKKTAEYNPAQLIVLGDLVHDIFFFKQKTAYELAQCDWSSDVCSSDLPTAPSRLPRRSTSGRHSAVCIIGPAKVERSEERRVGKECIEPCRSRWSPY